MTQKNSNLACRGKALLPVVAALLMLSGIAATAAGAMSATTAGVTAFVAPIDTLGVDRGGAGGLAPSKNAATISIFAPTSAGDAIDVPPLDPSLPRPDDFLGAPLGARFNHWDRLLAYLEVLDAASDRVSMSEYGRTAEGRPLVLLAITSSNNAAKLETLRSERLRLAEPDRLDERERARLIERLPVAVWLSFGIHGDESSSAEAAAAVAYTLAAAKGETAELLDSMIVLLDPLANPDGRERYVASFEQRRGRVANPTAEAAEHAQPWPGGRTNHYLFDLNRDWAWATQPETRARIAAYRQWEPQAFVDFHEMNSESTYFFPPAAEPIHARISRRTVGWLEAFGRANAAAFDAEGWLYFKGENYDLFYPAYGDTYPGLRGGVGMTYEMAGGGRAGEAIRLSTGATLTLADRVVRHFTTALATVRTAGRGSKKLLADFVANRLDATTNAAPRSYLWSADAPEGVALADLLARHGIRVATLSNAIDLAAKEHAGGEERTRRFARGTYVVSTAQPLGNLAEALLERRTQVPERFAVRQSELLAANADLEFYDITAWSLPLAFNLETHTASTAELGATSVPASAAAPTLSGKGDLGVLVRPRGVASYRFASALSQAGIAHRVARRAFSSGDQSFPSGTLFIPRHGNPANFEEQLQALLAASPGVSGVRLESSFDLQGISLGSSDMAAARPVRLGIVGGEGVDANSFGALWFLFDVEIEAPSDRLDLSRLGDLDLSNWDVLVLPDGRYGDRLAGATKDRLDAWVKLGGILVAIGGAADRLQEEKWASFEPWEADEDGGSDSDASEDPEAPLGPAEKAAQKRPIPTPGAALATELSATHPLAVGLPSPPPVLVEGERIWKPTGDPQKDLLTVAAKEVVLSGFVFPAAVERLAGSLVVATESRGRGGVAFFAQDPAFRMFWRGTMPILLNAVLFGPTLGLGGR